MRGQLPRRAFLPWHLLLRLLGLLLGRRQLALEARHELLPLRKLRPRLAQRRLGGRRLRRRAGRGRLERGDAPLRSLLLRGSGQKLPLQGRGALPAGVARRQGLPKLGLQLSQPLLPGVRGLVRRSALSADRS